MFHGVKQDSGSSARVCSYESTECTEVRLRDLLRSVLNIRSVKLLMEKLRQRFQFHCHFRRDIQFMRVLRVYNGPDARTGFRKC